MLERTTKPLLLVIAMAIGATAQDAPAQMRDPETALFAGGCFWCVESDFESVPGVLTAVSGYTGGHVKDPSYRQVTRGGTGHYEAVRITYDPEIVGYAELLHLFFRSVDAVDAGGQFCDRGESYRTAIFVSDKSERALAQAAKAAAEAELGQSVVIPILPRATFYEAEDYHQDYYRGSSLIVTRFGVKRQSEAYKAYREGCGRDRRVRALWGDDAPFLSHGS